MDLRLGFYRSGRPGSCPIPPADHYAEGVSNRVSHPGIPAEALARRSRLLAALRRMEMAGPSREPACLQALRDLLVGGDPAEFDLVLEAISREGLAEEAGERIRSLRPEVENLEPANLLATRLVPLATAARLRRTARWQLDTRRTLIRFTYIKGAEALDFDDGDLHALFLHAFRLEGLGLALDLGKRPRPLLTIGLPLSAGIGSRGESMDAVLRREPAEEPEELMTRLNLRLPSGLRIDQWTMLPGYATAPSDLALRSHWVWTMDPALRAHAAARVTTFLEASTWPWDRGPEKSNTPLDLRRVISGMEWTDEGLCFHTGMGPKQAVNPLKLLGAVFGLEPASITGLVRTGVDFAQDPRHGQADRFEPKLKNMYEDAVLLGGGSNIVLVEEDDDEPTILG